MYPPLPGQSLPGIDGGNDRRYATRDSDGPTNRGIALGVVKGKAISDVEVVLKVKLASIFLFFFFFFFFFNKITFVTDCYFGKTEYEKS